MKDEKKNLRPIIVLLLFSLFITIPFASALTLGDIWRSVTNPIKNIIDKIFNPTPSKSNDQNPGGSNYLGSDKNSDTGSGSSGSEGSTYNPRGSGNIDAPKVILEKSYTQTVPDGGALYHDVDVGEITLTCINCPSGYPNIAGFDYLYSIELINKGNFIAEDVDLIVSATLPDGEIRHYEFTKNRLYINPGVYNFQFTLSSLGTDGSNNLKDYSVNSGNNNLNFPVNLKVEVKNDQGVDRKEIQYKVTPRRECGWSGLVYKCKDLEPIKEVFEVDYAIDDPASEDLKTAIIKVDTINPQLFAGGRLNNPF